MAAALALIPGMVGIMGIGHFYVGKKAIGALLLLLGFFLALFALAGLLMVIDPQYQPVTSGAIVVGIAMNVLFLSILVWSSFDAQLTAKRINAGLR